MGESDIKGVQFVFSPDTPALLTSCNITLLVSTYQAQSLLLFSPRGEKMSMLIRVFGSPKGLAFSSDYQRLAMVGKREVWVFQDAGKLIATKNEPLGPQEPLDPHEKNFVPRRSYFTGDIAGHEVYWEGTTPVVVATRFSALARIEDDKSFSPFWQPSFVSGLVPHDSCHLNGVACDEHGPKFLTAVAVSNEPQGWRNKKKDGGVVITYPESEIAVSGLAMPHSPRIYDGALWVLNSGAGELIKVDLGSGNYEVVCRLPGFLRGLTFYGKYAFVGLSKARETNFFGGLPVTENRSALQCAVHIIDIGTGRLCGMIELTAGIEELFDICVLPKTTKAHFFGLEGEEANTVFLI